MHRFRNDTRSTTELKSYSFDHELRLLCETAQNVVTVRLIPFFSLTGSSYLNWRLPVCGRIRSKKKEREARSICHRFQQLHRSRALSVVIK